MSIINRWHKINKDQQTFSLADQEAFKITLNQTIESPFLYPLSELLSSIKPHPYIYRYNNIKQLKSLLLAAIKRSVLSKKCFLLLPTTTKIHRQHCCQ